MSVISGHSGLMQIASIEKMGNSPPSALTVQWTSMSCSGTEIFLLIVIFITDFIFVLIFFATSIYNFHKELKAFFTDPMDRMVLVGGYEMGSQFEDKNLTFGGLDATVPMAFFTRNLEVYDSIFVDKPPEINEWYAKMLAEAEAIAKGYIMAGIDPASAQEQVNDISELMTGVGGFVAAIMGDAAQTAAIMKTEVGDMLANYTEAGGQMQTTQMLNLLQAMQDQGLTKDQMLNKLTKLAKEEKAKGYKLQTRYDGAAEAARKRREEKKRKREEKKHERPDISKKEFLKKGQAAQNRGKKSLYTRKQRVKKAGLRDIMQQK